MPEKITLKEYQKLAMRNNSAKGKSDDENLRMIQLCNAGLGICSEAGEVTGLVKKHVMQGHALDINKVIEELGDTCWYIALFCEVLHINPEDILVNNIEKLKKRYPKGFSVQDSIKRVDEVEK